MRRRADLTTTIKREWLSKIIAGRKKIEYREAKPYWRDRLARVKAPFLLRLINGMQKNAPEVTVQIDKVRENHGTKEFEFHIGKVISFRNWDKNRIPKTK